MRAITFIACALVLAIPAPFAAAGAAAPAAKTATFFRGTPLPQWAAPLPAIPPTARRDPVVVRLAETQAWAGPKPAVLVSRAIQVNDKSRLGEIGQYGLTYFPAYQKLSLHRVAILRGDQALERTKTVNTRLLEREPSLESGFYVGETTVQLLLDDVRAGDTLAITYSIEGRNPVFGNAWTGEFMWDSTSPVELRRLVMAHPAGRPLQWRELGDGAPLRLQPVVERSGSIERLRFEARGLEAVESEQSLPGDVLPLRIVQASEYASWHDVAVWAAGLFERGTDSPAVIALAHQFENGKTQEERASAALHWVQDEIRYFSVALGENSHRPQAPDVVLKRRFGDCKDKSNLLIALLGRLGIKAEPVLVNSSSPAMPRRLLPSPSWFDHVIVRVQADGKTWFVDPTREGEKGLLSSLPVAVPGAAGLAVSGASDALLAIPEEDATFPLVERSEKFVIAALDGDAVLQARTRFRGRYTRAARQRFQSMSASERKNELLGEYEKQFRGVSLIGDPVMHDSDDGASFEVEARFALPKPVRHEDGWYTIDHESKVLDGSLGIPDKLVRKFPFQMPFGVYRARYRLQIEWPEQVRLIAANDAGTVDNPFFRAHKEYAWRADRLDYVLDYEVKRKRVEAAEMPELEAQSKLLLPYVQSGFKFQEGAAILPQALGYSYRNASALKQLMLAREVVTELDGGKKLDGNEAELICDSLVDMSYLGDMYPSSRPLGGALMRHLQASKAGEPAKETCRARLAFATADFHQAAAHFAKAALKDGDEHVLQLAWARFAEGDLAQAAAEVQRFLAARLKDGTLVPADAAQAVTLLQRMDRDLPAALLDYIATGPDWPWPRPVLAYQLGKQTQEQLLEAAGDASPAARELALADAWFQIGERALKEGRTEDALAAFRWLHRNGIRGSLAAVLAGAEDRRITVGSDPDYVKARAAIDARQYASAHDSLVKAAARGVAGAQYELGWTYEYGNGVKADAGKAFDWYRQGAEHGDLDAMNSLAICYDEGRGVAQDKAAALEWFRRAAAAGHHHASRNMGWRYRYGYEGVDRDPAKALPYLRDAAELGNPDAQAMVGRMYADGEGTKRDYGLALFWSELATEHGAYDGMATLAFLLAYGHGVEQDLPRAIALWRAAADKGSTAAQVQLGNAYSSGRGVEQDPRKAFDWFTKAARGGNSYATLQLAEAYLYGEGVGVDVDKAREFASKAAQDGNPDGYCVLGHAYRKGRDSESGGAEAIGAYRKGAELGASRCQLALALAHEFGRGVSVDTAEAAKWYRKAADQGSAVALNNLADLYEHGNGVELDLPKAVDLYRQAARKSDATAMLSLGELYEAGKGMAANAYLACVYYQLANRLGEKRAGAALERINRALDAAEARRAGTEAGAWNESTPLPGDAEAAPLKTTSAPVSVGSR